MALNVVQPNFGQIQGMATPNFGTVLPPQPFTGPVIKPGVSQAPVGSGVYNPQQAAAPALQKTAPGGTLQPSTTQPQQSGQTFGFMDGTQYNLNGQQVSSPALDPQHVSNMLATAHALPPPNLNDQGAPTSPTLQAADNQTSPAPALSTPAPAPGIDPSMFNDLLTQIKSLSSLSPEEQQAQTDLNNLSASTRQGYTNIQNKVIPLEFINNEAGSLDRRASDLAVPLQAQLALAQAKRTAGLEASKFGLTTQLQLADLNKPVTVSAGSNLVNQQTGKALYSAPPIPQYSGFTNPLSPSGYTAIDTRTGLPAGSFGSTGSTPTGGFPQGAQTSGSAAAVNNPLGIKPNGQFSQYSSPDQGFQAGVALVQKYQAGGPAGMNANSPLSQMINTWITGNPNNTSKTGYDANNVAQYLQQMGINVTPNTPIGQIDPTKLAAAIAHFETGYTPGAGGSSSNPIMTYAQQLLSHDTAPSLIPSQYQALANQYASQLNPAYSPAQAEIDYNNKQQAQTLAVPLVQKQQVVLAHLDGLMPYIQKAGFTNDNFSNQERLYRDSSPIPLYGKKDPNIDALKSQIDIVRGDIASVLAGGGSATEQDKKDAANALPYDVAPENFAKIVQGIKDRMADKIKEYSNTSNLLGNNSQTPPPGLSIEDIKKAYNINY